MPVGSDSAFAFEGEHADPEGFLRRSLFVCYDKDYAGKPVVCFDAAADGRVALGFNMADGLRYAAVLDADGTFLYGFSFKCTGTFQLDWTAEGLGIYWVRSGVFAVFDEEGECLSMRMVDNNSASSRHANALESPIRTLPDGGQLRLRNPDDAPASAYAQLVRIAPDGTETVLYDAPGSMAGSAWFWRGLLVLAGVMVSWIEIRKFGTRKGQGGQR